MGLLGLGELCLQLLALSSQCIGAFGFAETVRLGLLQFLPDLAALQSQAIQGQMVAWPVAVAAVGTPVRMVAKIFQTLDQRCCGFSALVQHFSTSRQEYAAEGIQALAGLKLVEDGGFFTRGVDDQPVVTLCIQIKLVEELINGERFNHGTAYLA